VKKGSLLIWMLVLAVFAGAAGAASARQTAQPAVPLLELPALEEGRIIEIPLNRDPKTALDPREECYLYEEGAKDPTGYADPSITVNFGTGRIYETNYQYARIRIANASQLRTFMASAPGSKNTTPGHDLAKRVKAVVAINGDYCGGDDITKGSLMRQGQMLRLKCDAKFDLLVIDKAGDFHILENARNADVEAIQDQAVNIFTFGPALVVNGQPKYGVRSNHIGSHKAAQRMALCQTGPLEYLIITCEGPENEGSVGLTIDQFVDLVSSMPDVQQAYNLDGGSSATVVFRRDGKNWRKVNALSSGKVRPLKDIIYFSTAWDTAPEFSSILPDE